MNELFNKIREITLRERSAYEESRKRGEQFNIFHACGVNHYETKHSGIIAEMLNPNGTHGQGVLFLRSFIQVCKPDIDFSLNDDVEVITESPTDDGRIDILITNADGQAIVIENKIYAEDQWEQLKRYDRYAKRRFGTGNYSILYLTLDGKEASEQSGGEVKYQTISYSDDIVRWLGECIKQSAMLPMIRETLLQYQKHIKQLTDQDYMATKEELYQTMLQHPEEIEEIAKAMTDGYFEWVFNNKVKENLETELSKYGLLLGVGKNITWMYFYRQEWRKTSICVYVERGYHYIGVTSANEGTGEDMKAMKHSKMECLENEPTQVWPYGWETLKQYSRWGVEDGIIQAMMNGDFVKTIMEYVKKIVNEIDSKALPMP